MYHYFTALFKNYHIIYEETKRTYNPSFTDDTECFNIAVTVTLYFMLVVFLKYQESALNHDKFQF